MSKKSSNLSKKYLKIIGVVEIVFAVIAALLLIFIITQNPSLTEIGLNSAQVADLEKAGIATSTMRTIIYITMGVGIAIGALVGGLLIRAANNPRKSTLVLVLTVLSVIGYIYTLFSAGFSNFGTVIGNLISLTINVLALMALFRIRSEIDE